MKLHIKRCILCLLLGAVFGGWGGWQARKLTSENQLIKFVVTGEMF